MPSVRGLFVEYLASLPGPARYPLATSADDEAAELAGLPGAYAAPGGSLLLAHHLGRAVGCAALQPLENYAYANAAEMKRLYVQPANRGIGLGRQLSEVLLATARQLGYSCVLLDTLSEMEAARALYEDLGFKEVPPYYDSPTAGAHYLKVVL